MTLSHSSHHVNTAEAVLTVEQLTVSYRGARRPAVDRAHLTIRRGEVVALIGESGSGKSTLSKAVIGLLPKSARIDAGSIRVAGHEITQLRERELVKLRGRLIGLVPQDPASSLDPVQPIGQQLTEVFRLHATKPSSREALHAQAVQLLELVGIDRPEERLRQYPHELSGGMKQRVLIAMAFGLRPQLLVADEPTSALDVTVQAQVLEVFDKLARETGVAVLFVTHNLAVASDHAARAVVMQSGRVLESGRIDDVITSPEHSYTRELIAHAFRQPARHAAQLQAADTAIEVKGLTKHFRGSPSGHFTAVDEVSFEVAAGSTFALVGESGSGKSTTARMIMGLTRSDAGSVRIQGREATGLSGAAQRAIWREIQLVHQNPQVALDPRLTIAEIVAEPLAAFGLAGRSERQKRVAELLDRVGLSGALAARKPRELSGGQQQRVAIARALAPQSRIVVLDEPLSALDVVTQGRILDLLAELQRELGLTYLFISHDLDLVRSLSDSVAVLRRGRLIEAGPTAEVFRHPSAEYTQALIAATPGRRLRAQRSRLIA